MTKLHEVTKTLIDIAITIDLKFELINSLDKNDHLLKQFSIPIYQDLAPAKELYGLQIKEYCIIKICSFIDEYEKFFNVSYIENEYKELVSEAKLILKPLISEIKRDYQLKEYRNHILAHNLRDNSKSLILGEISREYKFPKTTEEFRCIKIIIQNIIKIIHIKFRDFLPTDYLYDKVIETGKIVMDRNEKKFDMEKIYEIVKDIK